MDNTVKIAGRAGLLLLSIVGPATAGGLPPAATELPSTSLTPVLTSPWTLTDVGRFWTEIDYFNWTMKGDRPPALVTTSAAGAPLALAGVLGAPSTTVLFGDSAVNGGWRKGERLQAGYWFDRAQSSGIEASVFGLENQSSGFYASSSGGPSLARPFFNTASNQQDAQQIAYPGVSSGRITVRELSRLFGAGALYRQNIWSWGGSRDEPQGPSRRPASNGSSTGVAGAPANDFLSSGHIGVLIGYRYRSASDRLNISSTQVAGPVSISISDMFGAANNFHGLDLGLTGDFSKGRWSLEWRGKVALGINLNDAQINGSTASTTGGVTSVMPGGLLAPSSNIGNTSQIRFVAMPEFAVKVGYQVAPQWQIVAGYDVMYWPGVQRAGNLVDTSVNPALLPSGGGGGPPPGPQGSQATSNNSLLAQGFKIGLRFAY